MEITITEILDDLRAADETTRHFERRYWLSSDDFYALYDSGQLDDGEHTDDFAEWAGYYRIKLDREQALKKLSHLRLVQLQQEAGERPLVLNPPEPSLKIPA